MPDDLARARRTPAAHLLAAAARRVPHAELHVRIAIRVWTDGRLVWQEFGLGTCQRDAALFSRKDWSTERKVTVEVDPEFYISMQLHLLRRHLNRARLSDRPTTHSSTLFCTVPSHIHTMGVLPMRRHSSM